MELNTSLSPTYAQLAILSMRYTKQKPDKIQQILYKKSLKLRHEYQLDILSDDNSPRPGFCFLERQKILFKSEKFNRTSTESHF